MTRWHEGYDFETGLNTPDGRGNTRTLRFYVTDTNERDDVITASNANVPNTHDGLDLQNFKDKRLGEELWLVVASYGTHITQSNRFRFDTTGNTQRITHGLSETRYGPAGVGDTSVPPQDGALNVQDGHIEGTTKIIPGMTFSITRTVPELQMTDAYVDHLEWLTGTVNRDPVLGRTAESLLFLGASGGNQSGGDAEVEFNYLSGRHLTSLTLGSVAGIVKKAHQHIWPLWSTTVDATANRTRKRITGIYVNDVADIEDWAAMLPT